MVLGFLGKGGSGKSTLSTLTTKYLTGKNKTVLAIDADHNMDLTYNLLDGLKTHEDLIYFGSFYSEMLKLLKVDNMNYSEFVLKQEKTLFKLSPLDKFLKKYSNKIYENLFLMIAGEHNSEILHGQKCSHSLATPLKLILPLLELKKEEYVVIDYIAGSDGASTGIVTGMDFVVVVVEDTIHSIKSAKQITDLLNFFDVPFGYVVNKKIGNFKHIPVYIIDKLLTSIPYMNQDEILNNYDDYISELINKISERKIDKTRLQRSKNKFAKNLKFKI